MVGVFRQDRQDLQDFPQKSYPVYPVNPIKGHDFIHRKVGHELWFINEHEKISELVRTKTNSGKVSSYRFRCVRFVANVFIG